MRWRNQDVDQNNYQLVSMMFGTKSNSHLEVFSGSNTPTSHSRELFSYLSMLNLGTNLI